MRRTVVVLAVMVFVVVISAGVALAANPGTSSDDILEGTERAEEIRGKGGDDRVNGMGGDDVVRGGSGRDEITGGRGTDRVHGGKGRDNIIGYADKDLDRFYGGKGRDVVQARDKAAAVDLPGATRPVRKANDLRVMLFQSQLKEDLLSVINQWAEPGFSIGIIPHQDGHSTTRKQDVLTALDELLISPKERGQAVTV